MDSYSPTNNANVLQQKCSRPILNKRITPAIPLIYVTKRQKYLAERARACNEAKSSPSTTVEVATLTLENLTALDVSTVTPLEPEQTLGMPHTTKQPELEITPTLASESEKVREAFEVNFSKNAPKSISSHNDEPENEVQIPITENISAGSEDLSLADILTHTGKQNLDLHTRHTSVPPIPPPDSIYQNIPPLIASQPLKNGVGSFCARYSPLQKLATSHTNFDSGSELNSSSTAAPSPTVYLPPTNYGYPPSPMLHTPRHSNGGYPAPLGFFPRIGLFPNQVTTNEMVTRPIPSFEHAEFFSPLITPTESRTHDPMTPHSFHGSQSPVHDQETALPIHRPYTDTAQVNNSEFFNDFRPFQTKPLNNPTREQCLHLSPPEVRSYIPQTDSSEGLNQYLSSQFADPTFVDCILELRYSDDRAMPVHIPGHSLIFARSITLKNMILASCKESSGLTTKNLLIESDDRFLRTDGFYMAIHRLYGNPLLDIDPVIRTNAGGQCQISPAQSLKERFDLALGYAAAGQILKLDVVVNRGCEIAGLTLDWTTLEKGLDFALDGGHESELTTESQRGPDATYGPCVNILLHRVVEFICHNFPPSFHLDTLVNDAMFVPRLPNKSVGRQFPPGSRLGHIRFGDHTSEKTQRPEFFQSPSMVLSRVLINLPWDILRCIFEFPRLVSITGDVVHRHQILCSVIQEREKRRLQVYNHDVSNAERYTRKEWNTVGWREEVSGISDNSNIPKLTRSWVGFNIPDMR